MNTIKNFISANIYDIIIYTAIALTVIGQITVGWNFYVGQGGFLVANILYLVRDIKLERPKSEITKDVIFTAITIGLIVVFLFK